MLIQFICIPLYLFLAATSQKPSAREVQVLKTETVRKPMLPFSSLPKDARTKHLLSLILQKVPPENILNGSKQLNNLISYLEGMPHNSYKILFEDDNADLIQTFFSKTSYILFEEFKITHDNDPWICKKCVTNINKSEKCWACASCLSHFHQKCSISKNVLYDDKNLKFCNKCFLAK